MARRSARRIPKLYLQWASIPDGGKCLELVEADESGEEVKGGLDPAATILADDNERQWLEIYPEEGPVRIPLSEIQDAIDLAREGVHGEKYYDDQER